MKTTYQVQPGRGSWNANPEALQWLKTNGPDNEIASVHGRQRHLERNYAESHVAAMALLADDF